MISGGVLRHPQRNIFFYGGKVRIEGAERKGICVVILRRYYCSWTIRRPASFLIDPLEMRLDSTSLATSDI